MKTTITVEVGTRKRLMIAKHTLGCQNVDETINKIMDALERVEVKR